MARLIQRPARKVEARPPRKMLEKTIQMVEKKRVPANWQDALQRALEGIRAHAKTSNEPEAITNSKVAALLAHNPENGNRIMWTYKENGLNLLRVYIVK
jgi:hypothetical protein